VSYFDGDAGSEEEVAAWLSRSRFPGIWALNDSNFYEFTHSARRVAIVAVDPASLDAGLQEMSVRHVASRLRSDFYFGMVDGVAWADALGDFNIHSSRLPRVLVAEPDFEAWYEDESLLSVERLEEGLGEILAGTTEVLRQTRSAVSRLLFYQREVLRWASWFRWYAQQGPREAGIAAAGVAAGAFVLYLLGLLASACCRELLMPEMSDRDPYYMDPAELRRAKRD